MRFSSTVICKFSPGDNKPFNKTFICPEVKSGDKNTLVDHFRLKLPLASDVTIVNINISGHGLSLEAQGRFGRLGFAL